MARVAQGGKECETVVGDGGMPDEEVLLRDEVLQVREANGRSNRVLRRV